MGVLEWIVIVITIILGALLTIIIMKQDSKSNSSAVTGGSNTFYGSNKGNTLDGMLSKATVVLALLFIVFCVITTIVLI